MVDLFPIGIADEIGCVEREIKMRERVYSRRVAAHQMTQGTADREIALMRSVLARLRRVKDAEQAAPHDRSSRL